jgi:hypothetical protein
MLPLILRENAMATKTSAAVPTQAGAEATCPECRMNQVEPPFDYCSMCEMLTSYFREKLATAEQLNDNKKFDEAYEKWRSIQTWAEIEHLRDTYWTSRRRARARSAS